MKALLFLVGLVFVVAGIATGVVSQMDYGNALIGLNLGLAATLLVGGFVLMGLSSALGAISGLANTASQDLPSGSNTNVRQASERDGDMPFPAATAAVGATAGAAGMAIGSAFDKTDDSVDAAVDKVAEVANEAKEKAEGVADTVGDLANKAKDTADSVIDDVAEAAKDAASDAKDDAAESVDEATSESNSSEEEKEAADQPETESEEGENGDQLYIVEEVEVRGKTARILSDNTVEAETEEGWMRFENIEHLEEYLDAMDA